MAALPGNQANIKNKWIMAKKYSLFDSCLRGVANILLKLVPETLKTEFKQMEIKLVLYTFKILNS